MRLGVHVPIAGGLPLAIERAAALQCTTMQIFSRSPRGGPAPALTNEQARTFDAARRAAGIDPLLIHGPYIINLASPEAHMWGRSVVLFKEEYARAVRLNAQYLVIHVGSHMGSGEAAGIARVAEAVTQTLAAHPKGGTLVLLENTAGAGQGIGYAFEHLAAMRAAVEDAARVGICLDTAHLFAAGHPIHTAGGLEEVIASFDRCVGLPQLRAVHLNDSKVGFGEKVDRHWHIGQGKIGLAPFRRIVNHPRLNHLPFILETPKSTPADDRRNLATIRTLAAGDAPARRAQAVAC